MTCINGYKVQVLLSANGHYIGTLDDEGVPMCRLSVEYFKSRAAAQRTLDDNSFTRRNGVEIEFCSGGKPCF